LIPEEPSKEEALLRKAVASGKLSADAVARAVVAAVKEERFYVLTHPRIKGAVRARMEDILDERAPRNPLALLGEPRKELLQALGHGLDGDRGHSRPSSRVAMLSPVVPILGPTASAMRQHPPEHAAHQRDAHDERRDMHKAVLLRVDDRGADRSRPGEQRHCQRHHAGKRARLELPGFRRRLAHLSQPWRSASRGPSREHQAAADLEAGTLAPIRRSKLSPKSAEPASTANTVSVTMYASAAGRPDWRPR